MIIPVESLSPEASIPQIEETEEEKRLSIDGLRRFYKAYARKNFRHHPYINKNTGWQIRVSDQGIGEIRKFRKREHIILVRMLDIMLEDAILRETVPDNKNTPGVESVSYLDYECKVNEQIHTVQLTVKKIQNCETRIFYYYKFVYMELK